MKKFNYVMFFSGDSMKAIHEVLRDYREDNEFTQQDIANYLEIGRTMYRRYELGETEIPIRHLKKLCMLYKVSADYLIGLPKGLKWGR